MKELLNSDSLHHAYCVVGERENILPKLCSFFEEELSLPTKGNPDFFLQEVETFGIDEGRNLREMQTRKQTTGDRKIFLVAANALTHEAQNALLKVLEEPTPGTHFFFVIPSASMLLPTLRSRLFIISSERDTANNTKRQKFVERFIDADDPTKRLEMIHPLIEEKNKERAIRFLLSLEEELYRQNAIGTLNAEHLFALEEIGCATAYLRDRSPSVKLVLEHISFVTPVAQSAKT